MSLKYLQFTNFETNQNAYDLNTEQLTHKKQRFGISKQQTIKSDNHLNFICLNSYNASNHLVNATTKSNRNISSLRTHKICNKQHKRQRKQQEIVLSMLAKISLLIIILNSSMKQCYCVILTSTMQQAVRTQNFSEVDDNSQNYTTLSGSFRNLENQYRYLNVDTQRMLLKRNPKALLSNGESVNEDKLLHFVISGLGLKTVPDMSRVNISQEEYVKKYQEYIERAQNRSKNINWFKNSLNAIFTIPSNKTQLSYRQMHMRYKTNSVRQRRASEGFLEDLIQVKSRRSAKSKAHPSQLTESTNILLNFYIDEKVTSLSPTEIEDVNLRLMLIYSPALSQKYSNARRRCNHNPKRTESAFGSSPASLQKKIKVLKIKVYWIKQNKRFFVQTQKIILKNDQTSEEESQTQWMQFDITKSFEVWLTHINEKKSDEFTLEIQCNNCKRLGARILADYSDSTNPMSKETTDNHQLQLMPVINIVERINLISHSMQATSNQPLFGNTDLQVHNTNRKQKSKQYEQKTQNPNPNKSNNCHKKNQRCCRHALKVVFKEIKGFEFIIQPKVFDAGYCQGRCPPRYNPANHHALLQSLIWYQNRTHVPRPCCAPSKLEDLEVLHVDEKDSEKLKISTWSDMRILECACS